MDKEECIGYKTNQMCASLGQFSRIFASILHNKLLHLPSFICRTRISTRKCKFVNTKDKAYKPSFIPAGIPLTQIVNPEKGRTLYDSWGTTRCSFQHWWSQFMVTIGFFRLFRAHCRNWNKVEEKRNRIS